MVLLTIFREVAEGKTRRCSRTYQSVGEAVQNGQRNGFYCDIYDTVTCLDVPTKLTTPCRPILPPKLSRKPEKN